MTSSTAHPPIACAAELDEASLQRLHELDPDGSNHVVQRVLQAFDASLQRLLPQGDQAFAQSDRDALRHVVHTLKSSSASVGALDLSRRCGDIENRLRDVGVDGLAPLWDGFQLEGRRVQAAVQSLLDDMKIRRA
jgi:HPt (histidine-containing phosphotransfer) domain-containing protein